MKAPSFSTLSRVVPENPGSTEATCLTLDIDWAEDAVVNDAIDLIEEAGVAATWFVTHASPTLDRLRANPRFELGIHPNFNNLLAGDPQNGRDLREVVGRLMDLVPEAKCLRSHSLCSSTKLLQVMPEFGLTHECNLYLPLESRSAHPFRIWNGVVRVPHAFEDDLFLFAPAAREGAFNAYMRAFAAREGLKVTDFHPIHLFLNTESLDRYERTRTIHRRPEELRAHRHGGEGTRTALETLLEAA